MFSEIKKNFGFGLMRLPMIKTETAGKDALSENGASQEKVNISEVCKMVDAFVDAGFNYFDTAHGYLNGLSEQAFKECVAKRYPREKFVLTNKLSTFFFNSQEEIRPLFESQLECCGVTYFDFYLMHAQDASIFEKYKKCKAYETALELKKEGKIKHFGISFHDSPEVLDRILTEYPEIEAVQIQFNYADLHDTAVEALRVYEVCRKHNKPSIVMEPVKGGNLVNLPEGPQKIMDDFQKKRGTRFSNASYAIRFAASYDNNFMILSGMSSFEQMQDNLGFMENFKPLDDEERAMIHEVADAFNKLDKIPCTLCHYCVRDNHCPKDIQIPELFSCFNKKKLFNSWNQDYYYENVLTKAHGKASDCIKCGKCEKICPQHLGIRSLLEEVAAEFEKKKK